MKKSNLFILIIITLFMNINIIKADKIGDVEANTKPNQDTSSEGQPWKWNYNGKDYYNGLKVTVYKKNGQYITTKVFLNDRTEVETLNKSVVMVTNTVRRLENKIQPSTWSDANSTYFQYLDFSDYFRSTVKIDILTFLKSQNEEELMQKLDIVYEHGFNPKDYILVIEPAIRVNNLSSSTAPKGTYFGTYWEYIYWYNSTVGIENDFRYVLGSVIDSLGESLMITASKVNPQEIPIIWEFLDHFPAFKSKMTKENSLGVALVALSDVVETTGSKQCTTNVTVGSCNSNYIINEPTDEECIVNNISTYKDASVGDCGVIMCSYQVSTNLDNFFRTFTPIIKSGRYFPLNSVEIDLKKTCYLISRSDNVGCNNWYTYIKEENAGTLSLELVSKYTLVEDSINSTFETKCESYSNGKCTKATSTQHIEYVLEPNTNRFISIKDMAATVMGPGDSIIDLGGEHLTTPISLSTGKHNYTIDYSNSILNKLIPRLRKTTIELKPQKLTLEYDYTNPLTIGDLKYSCEYEALNESKCVCEGECCDSNCKVVECSNPDIEPGGFPEVIYRPINLEEAFPGQDGKGRDYGSNWKGEIYDESGNVITKPDGTPYTKEEYYVNYNRGYDDYEVYQGEPLYVIKLDYTSLKKIREYNDLKNHDYNDFELTCTEGEKCISNFLRGRARGFDINLIESGTCKDINSSTFDSCITRD